MAKIFYAGIPAHGHTNPVLPLLRELAAHGHDVRVYNAAYFRAKFDELGITFAPYPEPIPSEREIVEQLKDVINLSVIISSLSERLTDFMLAEVEREKPDLILYDTTAMWGYIAARTHHIRHICTITHFVLDGSRQYIGLGGFLHIIGSALPHLPKLIGWKRRMAQKYGKEIAGGITEYGDLNLVFTSKEFHPPNTFVDERFRFVGASIDARTRDGDFPFDQIGEERVVYVSLGTIVQQDIAFYRAVFEAFKDYPAQFILSAGKHTDLTALGTIPQNFIVRPFVPQLEILKRADAFITHGGMNSVHEGLYYGVPEVVVPHQFEQKMNAMRVAETGAGVMLGNGSPDVRVTPEELKKALDTVLSNGAKAKAAAMGETLKSAGGYARAVREIEAFLAA